VKPKARQNILRYKTTLWNPTIVEVGGGIPTGIAGFRI
jgi:hypothetical protein